MIVNYLLQRKLSRQYKIVIFSAIKHACEMNDLVLNWKKIKKFIRTDNRDNSINGKDRGYFHEEIHYYFKSTDELARRDPTFSYSNFVECSIEELRKLSHQGGGDKTPGIWRDADGKLRDKFGQLISPETGNKEAYQ